MDAAKIITELGGSTDIASHLGLPMTTVASWRRFNRIPHWRIPAVEKMAVDIGKPDIAAALRAPQVAA